MHVVDDIHRVIVDASDDLEDLEVVIPDLVEVEDVTLEFGDPFDHERTRDFAATTIDSQEQSLSEVGTCTEELDLLTDLLIRYAASDTVVIRVTGRAHQVVILVLDRRRINRYLSSELLEAFGE